MLAPRFNLDLWTGSEVSIKVTFQNVAGKTSKRASPTPGLLDSTLI